jgi:aldehyde dehydrogenase (NAD+)
MHSPNWLERAVTFRYPPFNATEIPKRLKLKAKFKRGESIDDQRRNSSSITSRGLNVAATIAVLGTLYYYFYH